MAFDSTNCQTGDGQHLSSLRTRSYRWLPPINQKLRHNHDLKKDVAEWYYVKFNRFSTITVGTYTDITSLSDPSTVILETQYDKYGVDRPIQYLWACRHSEKVKQRNSRKLVSTDTEDDETEIIVSDEIEYEFLLSTPTVAPTMDSCWTPIERVCCEDSQSPINIQWLESTQIPSSLEQQYLRIQIEREHTAYFRLSFYENWNFDNDEIRYFVEIAFLGDADPNTIELRKREGEYGDFEVIDSAILNEEDSMFWISWSEMEWFMIGIGSELDQQVLC